MLLNHNLPNIEVLNNALFDEKKVSVNVLRLDAIHPIASGNKIFKLSKYLQIAKELNKERIITFGGAYSNHLVATAYCCTQLNLKSIGFVRGERPNQLSHTLQHCINFGMEFNFISREDYAKKDEEIIFTKINEEYANCLIIPEGGFGIEGRLGATEITNHINPKSYTHICLAVGTGTTLSGILSGSDDDVEIIGVPVLKNLNDIGEKVLQLTNQKHLPKNLTIWGNYHFGGYAKKNTELLNFINYCWQQFSLPLDFVYTGKAFYGLLHQIENNYFKPGGNILFIHTGGLQGNLSLPKNTLRF